MQRRGRWILWGLGGLLALPLLALALLMLAAGSPSGRTAIEHTISALSADQIVLNGLGSGLPGQLSIKRIELRDAGGPWLTIDELILDWLPVRLLAGEAAIERLHARQIAILRLPAATAEPEPKPSGGLSLPMDINLNSLAVERFEMAPPVAGQAIILGIDGRIGLNKAYRGEIDLSIRQLEGGGMYRLQGGLTGETLKARLSLHEAAQGPLAALAGLRDRQMLNLEASLDGPLSAVDSRMTLKLDDLQAQLGGIIGFIQPSADLSITATAPAMQLTPDLAWRALALNMQLQGPLNELNASGGLHIEGLNVAQTAIGGIAIKLQGSSGRINLDGELAGLRLQASQADLLHAAPLAFQVKLDLDQPDYPAEFELKHPMIEVSGRSRLPDKGESAELALNLRDLQPFAALGGLQLEGRGILTLKFARQDDKSQLDMAGMLNTSGGSSLAKLLGESAKFDLSVTGHGEDIALSRLQLDGKALTVSAHGELASGNADFSWQTQLNDVSAIAASSTGHLVLQGSLSGKLDNLALAAKLDGDLTSKGYAGGPVSADIQLQHLPHTPNGGIKLAGMLTGSPIDVRLTVNSPGDKTIQLEIDQASWKSAHAQGGLMLTRDNSPPAGKIDMKITRLADFRPMLGQPLSGSIDARLEMGGRAGRSQAKVRLEARNTSIERAAMIDNATLALTVSEPGGHAGLDGLLTLNGINSGKVNGSAQLKLEGPMDAVRLRLSAALPNLNGGDAQLNAAAQLNSAASSLAVSAMQVSWRQQTVRLLSPAKIVFAGGLSVDRLQLGLQQAELDIGGRFSPELAVTAELRKTSAELLSLFVPDLAMSGTLHADANLHGSLAQPAGLVRFEADKLQMKQGSGRGLPPARITAAVSLHGEASDVKAELSAGSDTSVKIAGQAPMTQTGLFDLHGEAALDLKQLNPLLSAEGRRMRGQLLANAKLAGMWSSPSLTGSARINGGGWQDDATGVGISDIMAELEADNGALRIVNLQGSAGPGTLSVTGSAGLSQAGLPIDLTVTARNAKPLSGDRLAVNLDADVMLRGLAAEQLTASGRIRINRADIRIPERMPVSIAVLKLNNPVAPPPPPEKKSIIALDLTIDAPSEIFVRGRGVDAELGGTVHVAGTANEPVPDGAFKLRNGQFTLAGQTLVFNQGEVGFESGSLTDPSLNFVANTNRNNIAASLAVTGSALHPKISLSSSPQLPQDEILANLLFGKGTTSLSPLEMVQIASTLASLTGVTSGGGDPLEMARKRLGLDRLSAGGANPSVEGGRYIAPGVYLGAKQGISGGNPQAMIQIDVTKGLKLESSVGSGAAASGASSANSVGVIYQFEY